MRRARPRAKYLRWLPPLLALACGAVPTGDTEVDKMVNAICAEHGALCVATDTKEDLGFDEYAQSVYWGRFSYGEIEASDVRELFPGVPVPEFEERLGVACYESDRCREDLVTCAAVVLHEIGHQYEGSDQTDADCWAARHATREQRDALVDLVCSFNDPPRCTALRGCLP